MDHFSITLMSGLAVFGFDIQDFLDSKWTWFLQESSGDKTTVGAVPLSTSNDAHVRYENDRLKIALAQR